MKVNVTFDCTPEEARALFGLPDLQPFQAAILSELQGRVKGGFAMMDPLELIKTIMGQYAGGLEQFQGFLSRLDRANNLKKEKAPPG